MKQKSTILSALFLAALSLQARVFYVDGQAETNPAWPDAHPSLQDAIDAAAAAGGGEIWLRGGIYKPAGESRTNSFILSPGVELYGGFRGIETERDQRKPRLNRTVLSGDIGRAGLSKDNCFHVVRGASNCRLDSLILSGGQADGTGNDRFGGGLLLEAGATNMLVTGCTFEKNHAETGGAIYTDNASLLITNTSFYANSAKNGGAISLSPTGLIRIRTCTFASNHAEKNGGAMALEADSDCGIETSEFKFNSALKRGGALHVQTDAPKHTLLALKNCRFTENNAGSGGGGLYVEGTNSPLLLACSFTRNTVEAGRAALDGNTNLVFAAADCTFSRNRRSGRLGVRRPLRTAEFDGSAIDFNYYASLPETGAQRVVVESLVKAAAPQPIVPEKIPEPKRVLADVYGIDSTGARISLQALTASNAVTVLVTGDLTDPHFIRHYRIAEAAARDFQPKGVAFRYLYRALTHPENHNYLQPISMAERQQQLKVTKALLHTTIPWITDTMDNAVLQELVSTNRFGSNLFVFNARSEEELHGRLQNAKALREKLTELAGTPDTRTNPDSLNKPKLSPIRLKTSASRKLITFNPLKEVYQPIRMVPLDADAAHYVKPRIEADEELLKTGNGTFYLGFNIDPLYQMEWNNLATPIKYMLKAPSGSAIAPSIGSGYRSELKTVDLEPREFMLEARNLSTTTPIPLQISYSVRSQRNQRNISVTQRFLLTFEHDPLAGDVINRQISMKGAERVPVAPGTSKTQSFDDLLKKYDINRDRQISMDEASTKLRNRFAEIDTNGNGQLTEEEFNAFIAQLNQ